MALTKAQVSLVTVAALGAAPGGFTADLLNFGSQVEVAALALSVSPTQAAQTNAEFVNQVVKNLGTVANAKDKIAFLKALDEGTSRAEAAVDFANLQLVSNDKIANVDKAIASTSTSTTLSELMEVVTPVNAALTFDLTKGTATGTTTTTSNIGKTEIDAGAPKKSADYTFELKNQIGEDAKFEGKFLSPVLDRKAADTTGSQIVLELRNLREDNSSVEPLKGLKVDGIAFLLNGKILKVASEQINAALTYDALRTAVEARIAELVTGEPAKMPSGLDGESTNPANYAALATFSVTLGGDFTATNESGDIVSGKQIVLTDSAGQEITPITTTDAPGLVIGTGFTLYGELKSKGADSVAKSISTNLDADNVGYGSQGASVNLAGQSASNKGVEEIKVLATKGVWFTKLESKAATNHLQRVELKSGSEGYFRVGTQENSPNHVVSLVDQDFSKGGLVDVQQVEAGNAGSTAINSFVSSKVLGRYDFKDTGIYTADDSKAAISYNLSSGADILNLAISTKVLAAVDTQVNVNTGAGDDVITVMATNGLGLITNKATAATFGTGWLINQQLNNNIKIDAGAGNDWILTPGAGNATILAGAGNDLVRVDNTGDRGVFVFNNATTDINKLKLNQGLDSNSDNGLSAGANGVEQTFDFYKAVVKVTFKGFESKYITIDSTNYTTTTKQINQAIKQAINDDAVLSKLIAAHDNEGNALAIESLIDGTLALTDLDIEIQGPAAYSTTQTDIDAAKAAGKVMLANGEEAKADAAYLADGKTSTTASIDTTAANTAYDTQFGTSSTGANPFAALPAVDDNVTPFDAGVAGTLTFDLTGAATFTNGSGNVVVGGHTVAVSDTDTANDIAGKIYAVLNGLAATATVTFSGGLGAIPVSQLTFTDPAAGNNLVIGVSAAWILDNSATLATNHIPVIIDTDATDFSIVQLDVTAVVPTTAATAEEQKLTFVDAVNAGTVTVAGYDVAITAGMTKDAIATAVHTAINGKNDENGVVLTSTDNNDGTLTIEYPAVAGNVAPISVSQAGVGVNHDGGNSWAESDNVIDLGTGQDVLVLGTGALSNDTVLVKEYNLGHKTIVNFTQNTGTAADGTNGEDLLDFTSYLTNVDANGARVATSVGTMSGTANGNAVEIVDYLSTEKLTTASTAVITFEKLTAGDVKAMINNDDSASGLLNIDLNASGVASLTQNYVLMVHNKHATAGNEGEYKAFHVTSKGNSDEAATVQLIGTFDFGDVAGTSVLNGIDETNFA